MSSVKKKKDFHITIDEELCKGCSICVSICPTKTLSISKDPNKKGYYSAIQHSPEDCIGCNKCALMCPEVSIRVFMGVPLNEGIS
ncbi:4Fe-4S dicluster domain-containing protein [Neobacillus sp. PS3-40]|uniref:4Fe-4S dicluster domain-containing protein n=1 Tax=Neobacillus sp. PS3-40 TaxID=3070679 RepID=UPI0027E1CAC0|nr:4Fe-4S binding protein [Neobacillus sp. PS3-40]WML42994.1 4Fe-4S binding protein [Neobacillus sp. PS3-40]